MHTWGTVCTNHCVHIWKSAQEWPLPYKVVCRILSQEVQYISILYAAHRFFTLRFNKLLMQNFTNFTNSIFTNISLLGGRIAHLEVPSCSTFLIPQNFIQSKKQKCTSTLWVILRPLMWINCLNSSHTRYLPYLQLYTSCTVQTIKKSKQIKCEILVGYSK